MRWTPLFLIALLCLILVLGESPRDPALGPDAQAFETIDASAALSSLERAASQLAEERGRAYVALHGSAPILDEQQAALAASRVGSRQMLDEALAHLEATVGPSHYVLARVRSARQNVETMRTEIDHALGQPSAARDASIAPRWFRTANELVEGLHHGARFAWLWWAGDGSGSSTIIAVQLDAWRISEVVGRERAVIGAAIASGEPVTVHSRDALGIYQNRMTSDWRRLERLAGGLAMAVDLDADVARARRALFEELASARVQVLNASARKEAYPFTPQQWFSLASRTIDAVVELRRNAGRLAGTPGRAHSVLGAVDLSYPPLLRPSKGGAGHV